MVKFRKTALAILALTALAGIYMGVFTEEPTHFFNPDPACPLCRTLHTQIVSSTPPFLPPSMSASCQPVVYKSFQQYKGFCESSISIRAPPLS
jgi:hypothetical protein